MLKKIINKELIGYFLTIVILLLSCYFIYDWAGGRTDARKFKTEYEILNGQINKSSKKKYRSISIALDNPIEYITADTLVEKINNNETMVVYFGFAACPWCRSVIVTLLNVAKDLKLDKIYYVDVQNIRDVMILDDNNNPVTKSKGTDAYYQLLDKLGSVLTDYTLTDKDGKKINTGEKRIYAPNVVAIVNGEPIKMTTGISPLQTDAYMKLTKEMINDTYEAFSCVIKCVLEVENTCSIESDC